MSTRSTQVGKLGYELAGELSLRRVEIRWSGRRRRDSYGGWRVEWTDGPTVPRMRALVLERAERFPAAPVTELGYDRCRTDLAEAIALLLYVDRDRTWVDCLESPLLLSAYDSIDSPERADEVWQSRAKALQRYARGTVTTARAVNVLASHAQADWDNALAWLDQLVAEHAAQAEASNVVDLMCWRDEHVLLR